MLPEFAVLQGYSVADIRREDTNVTAFGANGKRRSRNADLFLA